MLADLMRELNSLGLWGIVNTIILLGGGILGLWFALHRVGHIKDLNFYITWQRSETARFPLILRIEVRNLSQNIIVISAPHFYFNMVKPGPFAHCDTPTQRYEIKFRRNADDKQSEVACLLRHREVVNSYIPLLENQTDEELTKLSKAGKFGTLFCNVVFLGSKPKVAHLKLKVRNAVPYKGHDYPSEKAVFPRLKDPNFPAAEPTDDVDV